MSGLEITKTAPADVDAMDPFADQRRDRSVVDTLGRKLTFAKLPMSVRLRVGDMLGPDASNETKLVARLAASVRSINGDRVSVPLTAAQIHALMDRLEDEGLNALADAHHEAFFAKAAVTEEESAVKNG